MTSSGAAVSFVFVIALAASSSGASWQEIDPTKLTFPDQEACGRR
jgi:hypothetical protein